ncbi:MAG TPA: endolytic transglycosylase MltG [Terriglobales bacterium]|nr:endolytic transglycosylase MltG [Terriglobales bacterium]
MKALVKFIFVVLLIAAACVGYAAYWPIGPTTEQFVMLRPGSSARKIARDLKAAGMIRSETGFLLLHAWKARSLKAGEYRFDHPANVREVYDRIARGDIVVHSVTIPEGYNIFEVAAAMEAAGLGKRADFLQIARDPALVKDIDPQAQTLEGYLFPDTYEFTRTQTLRDMAGVMVHRFRQAAQQLGMTSDYHRAVTMASIIEKESAIPDERPLVSSVYYNRLQKSVQLAADPTVVYASVLIGKYDGVIHQSDLALDSPYNTYKYAGLPPGPIANPGRTALAAALHPADTNYLYFVADPANPGHHHFAATAAEHARNVAAYRKSGH